VVNGTEVDGLSVTKILLEVVFGITVSFDKPSLPPTVEIICFLVVEGLVVSTCTFVGLINSDTFRSQLT